MTDVKGNFSVTGFFLFLAGIFLAAAGCSPSPPPEDPPVSPRPPIILMVKDALRADRLGCYGYHRPTSPNIDRFAEEAVLFEKALSNSPWSASSFMSLFTSLSPEVHGVSNLASRFNLHPRVSGRIPLLAEILREQGYLTVGLHGGGNIPAVRGFDRGFDYYGRDFRTANYREVAENIREWLERSRAEERPIFLFLHHLICHDPYLYGPSEFRHHFLEDPVPGLPLTIQELDALGPDRAANFWRGVDLDDPRHRAHIGALYDGGVYFSDFVFEELMEVLRAEGIYDEALIILTSDHGEALGEHGTRGHGALWREHLHIPLLVKFPDRKFGKLEISDPVGLMDIAPTLFDYLEITHPEPMQGVSWLPLLECPPAGRDRSVVSYRAAMTNPYFHLGEIRITRGDYVYIRQVYQPDSLWSHYLGHQDPLPEAEASMDDGGDDDVLEEFISRGDAYFVRDLFSDAERMYRLAVEAAPDDHRARLRLVAALREELRYREAEELARDLIDRAPDLAGAYRELAQIAWDQRYYSEAEERFARAVELFPEDARTYLEWGNNLRRRQMGDEAGEKLEEALRLADGDPAICARVISAFRWLERSGRAYEVVREQLERYPGNKILLRFLGELYLEKGQVGEAKRWYERASRENPEQVWPYLLRADFLEMIREQEKADGLLEKALELLPEAGWLLRAAGEHYLGLGDYPRAVELLTAAVEQEPRRGSSRWSLATALRRAGRLEEAERELIAARELLPGDDESLNLELGKIYLARGWTDEAGEIFARSTVESRGRHALYDIRNDPGETRNRFLELPRVAGRMMELEREIRAEDRALRLYYRGEGDPPVRPAEMTEEEKAEMRRELKRLGY